MTAAGRATGPDSAILCTSPTVFDSLRRLLPGMAESVDGPFPTLFGPWAGGGRVLVLQALPGADSAHAAVLLAARRGAGLVLVLAEALAAPAWLEASGTERGSIVFPSRSVDLQPLEATLNLLPDRAPAFLESPASAVLAGEELAQPGVPEEARAPVAMATLPGEFTWISLADILWRDGGPGLHDRASRGAVDGAREAGLPLVLAAIVTDAVGGSWRHEPSELVRQAALERVLRQLVPASG